MMKENKDTVKRKEICELLEEADLPQETKDRVKSIIERINNGDLEDMFNNLKDVLKNDDGN